MIPSHKAVAVILAGGLSSRMGENKAEIKFRGTSMLERLEQELSAYFEKVMISTRAGTSSQLVATGTIGEIVEDVLPGRGPLGGLFSVMKYVESELYFAAACDMPFPDGQLAAGMIRAASDTFDVVIPRMNNGNLHPLFAVYRRTCLPFIDAQLKTRNNKIIDFFDRVNVLYYDEVLLRDADPQLRCLENVNTREDLERIIRMEDEN